jgi:predicted transcriptional regulator
MTPKITDEQRQAIRQQEDMAAIQQGLDAAAEGRESTLEEADAQIRNELGFPS